MRILSVSTMAICLAMIVGCIDDSAVDDIKDLNPEASNLVYHETADPSGIVVGPDHNGGGIVVKCVGTCPDRECELNFNPMTGLQTCYPCTECKMRITKTNSASGNIVDDYVYNIDMIKVGQMFENRLNSRHNGKSAALNWLRMEHSDSVEFVQFEYFVGGNRDETWTVSYYATAANSYEDETEVDCRGSCDPGSTKICTEVFNTANGEIYCQCQSDNCKMKITQNN